MYPDWFLKFLMLLEHVRVVTLHKQRKPFPPPPPSPHTQAHAFLIHLPLYASDYKNIYMQSSTLNQQLSQNNKKKATKVLS